MNRACKTSALVATITLFGATQAGAAVVAHYAMGEAGSTGTELDDIGSNHMVLISGTHGIGAAAPGAAGSTASVDFDGSSYFSAPANNTSPVTGDNFRISAWVNPDLDVLSGQDGAMLFGDGDGGRGFVVFQTNNGNGGSGFGIGVGGVGGFWNAGQTVISAGTWYFVELERLNGVTDLRVDGVSQTGVGAAGSGNPPWNTGAGLGNQFSGGPFNFDGQIDDVTYEVIPEPGSLALLGLGGLALLRRRR